MPGDATPPLNLRQKTTNTKRTKKNVVIKKTDKAIAMLTGQNIGLINDVRTGMIPEVFEAMAPNYETQYT